MHRSMWEIPVLPWKEAVARLVAEAVRGGHASHVTSGGGGDGSYGGLLVHGGGALPSAIRSDCGEEFLGAEFRSWLKRHGIKQQLTTAYTPQSNGVPERANRTIIEGRRTILVDSVLPLWFWPLAIRHATVIKNRVLTHVGHQHWVPKEKWSGKKSLVDMLHVFGCMGLVHVPKEKCDKLQAAAVWAVNLGLARGSKGWLMWDPKSNTIFTTKDANFMEGLMFKEWLEWGRSKVTIPLGIEVLTGRQQMWKKALGPVGYYLGLHVERDEVKGWLRLHQHKYLAAMGEKYGLEEGRSVKTPLPLGFQLHLDGEEVEVLEYEFDRKI
ncbi:unnamed protein product [Closterium sp. NIES-53]